jgi:WhiB family redox-sensing transcriptional regulator
VSGLDWMSDGLCAQTDPELFHPEHGQKNAEAKRVCLACPVRATCLEWALETGQQFGIWGGAGEDERRRMRAARNRAGRAGEVAA